MSDYEPESTADGLLGKVAGKAKAAFGTVVGNDRLAREGRLQEASVDAEAEARAREADAEQRRREADLETAKDEVELERTRLQTEIAAERQEEAVEQRRRRADQEAETRAARQEDAVEDRRRAGEEQAETMEEQAVRQRLEDARHAARLAEEARRAEAVADAIDPEVR